MQAKKPFDKNSLIERDALIKARLDELREFAADEDESLNEGSIADFLSLMNENPNFLAPYIFSNYEGNISVTWKNEREKLSVVFEGNELTETTYFQGITKEFIPLPQVKDLKLREAVFLIAHYFEIKIDHNLMIGKSNEVTIHNPIIVQNKKIKYSYSERLAS